MTSFPPPPTQQQQTTITPCPPGAMNRDSLNDNMWIFETAETDLLETFFLTSDLRFLYNYAHGAYRLLKETYATDGLYQEQPLRDGCLETFEAAVESRDPVKLRFVFLYVLQFEQKMQEYVRKHVPEERWKEWFPVLKKMIQVDTFGWNKCHKVPNIAGLPAMSDFEAKVLDLSDLVTLLCTKYITI